MLLSDSYGKEEGILKEYLDYLHIGAKLEPSTCYNYYMTLRSLAKFLKHMRNHMDCQPDEVIMANVIIEEMVSISQDEWWAYLDYVQFTECEAANSFAVRISIVRGFYEWLANDRGCQLVTYVVETKRPVTKRQPFIFVTDEMLQRICDQFYERDNYDKELTTRNICILKIALYCGLGLTELCELDLEDVDLNNICVRESADRSRNIPLPDWVADAIDAYIPDRIPPIDGSNAFFVSAAEGRMHRGAIQKMLRKAVRNLGRPISEITFRDIHLTAKERIVSENGVDTAMEYINVKSPRYCKSVFGRREDE